MPSIREPAGSSSSGTGFERLWSSKSTALLNGLSFARMPKQAKRARGWARRSASAEPHCTNELPKMSEPLPLSSSDRTNSSTRRSAATPLSTSGVMSSFRKSSLVWSTEVRVRRMVLRRVRNSRRSEASALQLSTVAGLDAARPSNRFSHSKIQVLSIPSTLSGSLRVATAAESAGRARPSARSSFTQRPDFSRSGQSGVPSRVRPWGRTHATSRWPGFSVDARAPSILAKIFSTSVRHCG